MFAVESDPLTNPPRMFPSAPPCLFGLRGTDCPYVNRYIERANLNRDIGEQAPSSNGLVFTLFFEHSTRTRSSFEVAARRLGMDVVNLDVASSSLSKGESLEDTVRTIDAMGPDFIVVRHSRAGAPETVAASTGASVVNAGDGSREHPTQGLLDTMTICDHFGFHSVEQLKGLRIALVGDVNHSRVARSNLAIWRAAGAEVRLVGPQAFVPSGFEDLGYGVCRGIESGLDGVDVVYCLRVQTERQSGVIYPSLGEYHRHYGVTLERLDRLCPNAVVMHPGPVNRGVELTGEVMRDPRCLVERQVANGVWIRMAVFNVLAEARREMRHG